jgi:hypothetical protein
MKARNIVLVVALVLIATFAVAPAVSAQDGTPPEVIAIENYDVIRLILAGFLTYFCTLGVKSFSELFGVQIKDGGTAITGSVILAAFQSINSILATIPQEWVGVVDKGFIFASSLLVAFGVAGYVKKMKAAREAKFPSLPNV